MQSVWELSQTIFALALKPIEITINFNICFCPHCDCETISHPNPIFRSWFLYTSLKDRPNFRISYKHRSLSDEFWAKRWRNWHILTNHALVIETYEPSEQILTVTAKIVSSFCKERRIEKNKIILYYKFEWPILWSETGKCYQRLLVGKVLPLDGA